MSDIKCKKCRRTLFSDKILVTNHNMSYEGTQSDSCSHKSSVHYLNQELLSDWIVDQLNASEWTKGKIYCPNGDCNSRIGSFNFISGSKCQCDSHILPAIHVIKSKVDKPLSCTLKSLQWRPESKSGFTLALIIFRRLYRSLSLFDCHLSIVQLIRLFNKILLNFN